jgi:tetratricopeptide (TPR) repeat protein
MRRIRPGEGQTFFPYFFIIFSLLPGFLVPALLTPGDVEAQSDVSLSRFDRLAQQASELNQSREFDKALALLEPHKNDKKNDSALFFNELGVAYRHKGKIPEAIQAYEAALVRNPENPAVIRKNLGDAFFFRKDFERAAEQYQEVLRSNPRFQEAHFGLGAAYYKLNKYPEALSEFETALRLNPRDEKAREFRDATQKKIKGK